MSSIERAGLAVTVAILAWGTPSPVVAKPARLAVLPLEIVNLEASQQQALAELLVERLTATGAFELVSPDRVTAALKDSRSCVRSAACLQRLGGALKRPMLLQLAVAGLGGTRVVRVTLFDPRSGARSGSWQEVLDTLDMTKLSQTLDRMIAGFTPRPSADRKAWYSRWWVWTAAAGVVAAGTLTAVLLATGSANSGVDVVITPP